MSERHFQFSLSRLLKAIALFAAAAWFTSEFMKTFHPLVLGLCVLGALVCIGAGIGALFNNMALAVMITTICVWGLAAAAMIGMFVAGVR
jgi:hypothetical protein